MDIAEGLWLSQQNQSQSDLTTMWPSHRPLSSRTAVSCVIMVALTPLFKLLINHPKIMWDKESDPFTQRR